MTQVAVGLNRVIERVVMTVYVVTENSQFCENIANLLTRHQISVSDY
jgi:hypothetical protein